MATVSTGGGNTVGGKGRYLLAISIIASAILGGDRVPLMLKRSAPRLVTSSSMER
jgi:hypothetical protein